MYTPVRIVSGMKVVVVPDSDAASQFAAGLFVDVMNSARQRAGRAVVGLATGSTPRGFYAELVARHAERSLSFRNVSTFNLDEYYPVSPFDDRSYRSYMQRHLWSKVDIEPNHAHVLDGTVPEAFVAAHAAEFERWIEADDELDFQLLGVGRNGHIGFNEPTTLSVDEALRLRTRLVDLHPVTRADAARECGGFDRVIPRALTMGVATILSARSILVLALGSHKAEAVAAALTGPITAELPASLLQSVAEKVTWVLDEPAAGALAR